MECARSKSKDIKYENYQQTMISALLKPTLVINGKKYKVMKQIGEGGFAFVYNVMSTGKDDNGERYALKKMICQTDEQLDEAKKEIDTMAKIMHENVLPLVDFSYTINKKGQKEALLLLPLYMGSVQTIIENGQGFPYCGFSDGLDVLKILRCCVEGLTAIHACGIRHADLKPANILLSENYHAVLTDFGSVSPFPVEVHSRTEALAIQDQAASYTTASYRAPELYNTPSSCVIGGESDVWSFGCLMFCMMFSRSPFESAVEGLSTLSIISAHYQIPEGCLWPQEYLDVISRCLQPDPALRATLAWVREQLQIIPCPPLQLMADIPPPVAAAKSITSPTLPPTALATHGPLKVAAAMQGLGSSTSTTSSAVSTGQIAFSASSASFTDDGGSFPHTPVSPTGSGVAALEVNFANFPAPVHFDAAAMQIQTAGSQDEFASSSSGLSDLFFGGGSAVNSIAGSYVIAEGFETMSTFTSGNNSPMHQHGSSGHHQLGRSGDQEGSEAKSSNVSFEGFEFMEAPGGGGCSPRAAINFRTQESAASVSSALSGFGGSGVGIAEGSSATSDVFTLEEDDEFGEFTASTQDTAAALDNCTVQEQESNFAHFPVTHGAVAKEEGENHPDKNNNAVIETVDLWKLITGQAMPTDAKAGQPRQQKHQVVKEGPVHMMRLGGFPKRWAKKQVQCIL